MSNNEPKVKCPMCDEKNTWSSDNVFKPFCSERCKLIDLGEWASDTRKVSSSFIDESEL